jgi:RNA polymerase subunit RPABC4/transcription elongation factor Spt4
MTFDPTSLTGLAIIITAFGGAFIAALWLSLVVWTYRDIRSRARDPLLRILAVLVVAILFLPGIVVYLILRPPRTLEQEYQSTLEEEALLQSIEDAHLCPGCGRRIKDNWMICPSCHTRLKKNCHQCNKLMELPWNLCPYCGTPAPGMRREGQTLDDALRTLQVDSSENPAEDFAPGEELEVPEASGSHHESQEPGEEPVT